MKQAYATFCRQAPDVPLFLHDWYLDAVCTEGDWAAAVVEKGGKPVAVWPFFLKQKWGYRYVAMPPLCKMMGPCLLPEYRGGKHETALIEALLAQLPPLAAFEQDCHYPFQNWLPLYWQGFRQTTRYSYTLENTGRLEDTWNGLTSDYRNNKIPKAREYVSLDTTDDTAFFLQVHDKSFVRKGMKPPFAPDFLLRIDRALAAHGRRRMVLARDRQDGAVHSAAYLAWDDRSAWLLLAGDDPDKRASGAGMLVIWETIRYAFEELKLPVYDFAGSMIRPVERVRRQFGAVQQPYFRVRKEWSALWRLGKNWWR
ncbi:MAG: GNAT family N-acetyltransferase [Saprospiraceae bacterium]|nr:GNAT family N-acetyltransferase [Saprospiraceae bacterium]